MVSAIVTTGLLIGTCLGQIWVVSAYRGWFVMDNLHWFLNESYLKDMSIIPKRYHVMPADYYTTGVEGQFLITSLLPCHLKIYAELSPRINGVVHSKPTLTWRTTPGQFMSPDLATGVVPPVLDMLRGAIQDCVVPRADTCPYTQGTVHTLMNCTLSSILDLPEKSWKTKVETRNDDGNMVVEFGWEFHLDDTPLLRQKRPSIVQRRERKRQGKKPVAN